MIELKRVTRRSDARKSRWSPLTGAVQSVQKFSQQFVGEQNLPTFGGVYSGRVPPDPIPNSEVKPASGENSTEEVRR